MLVTPSWGTVLPGCLGSSCLGGLERGSPGFPGGLGATEPAPARSHWLGRGLCLAGAGAVLTRHP